MRPIIFTAVSMPAIGVHEQSFEVVEHGLTDGVAAGHARRAGRRSWFSSSTEGSAAAAGFPVLFLEMKRRTKTHKRHRTSSCHGRR
jgi:hypothetical protein